MMYTSNGNKTVVITLSNNLITENNMSRTNNVTTSPIYYTGTPNNIIQFVKEEPLNIDEVIEVNEGDICPTRKRQRLNHLTTEQKVMRRKLKNRVAAQQARDRKKERMDQLEEENIMLKKRINDLTNCTTTLTQENSRLQQENTDLITKLSQCTCPVIPQNSKTKASGNSRQVVRVRTPVSNAIYGSAEFRYLPWKVAREAVTWVLLLTAICCKLSGQPKLLQNQFQHQNQLKYQWKWLEHYQAFWKTMKILPHKKIRLKPPIKSILIT